MEPSWLLSSPGPQSQLLQAQSQQGSRGWKLVGISRTCWVTLTQLLGGAQLLLMLGVRTGVRQGHGPNALPSGQHFSNSRWNSPCISMWEMP